MNLIENLKQFKNIRPGADFSAFSKNAILGNKLRLSDILREKTPMTVATVALAFLFVFAGTKFFTGSSVASIDPRGLRAEAQAIDIQIQLTNLNYYPAGNETTPVTAENVKPADNKKVSNPAEDSIDDVLKELSE